MTTFADTQQSYRDMLGDMIRKALPDCDPVRGIVLALARDMISSCRTRADVDKQMASYKRIAAAKLDGPLHPAEVYEIGEWLRAFASSLDDGALARWPRRPGRSVTFGPGFGPR